MNVETIKMDPRIARIHYQDYRKRCAQNRAKRREALAKRANELHEESVRVHIARTRIEKEDEQLLKAYRSLYRGQQILDLPKTLAAGGLDEKKLPKLAVCQADAEKCFLMSYGNAVYFSKCQLYSWNRHEMKRAMRFEKPLPADLTNAHWRNTNGFPTEATALVPSIPPQLRPDDLSKYVILWEAEWTAKAPVDPLLLSKVNDTLYAVVAQWDLTPLEQRILEGRL